MAAAWRRGDIAAGSDFPVEEPNPMLGFYAAITRQDPSGNPPGGWMPDQRLSRDEALRAFTLDAAYAAHAETVLGSLEAGKLADSWCSPPTSCACRRRRSCPRRFG